MFDSAVERAGPDARRSTARRSTSPVYVDREMWAKIVLNLLSNALKFTFEGGIDRARGAPTTAAPELTVTDTGIGIEPADQARLFERFHRVAGARSRSLRGLGHRARAGRRAGRAARRRRRGARARRARAARFTVRLPFGAAHLPAEQVVARPSATRRRAGRPRASSPRRCAGSATEDGAARRGRRRPPAGAGRRRQRRHARLHRLAAGRPLRGRDRRRRRGRAGARAREPARPRR